MDKILLETRKLCFSYGDQPIVKNISLKLRQGEVLGLIGHSGSGKTSLLQLLAGLLEPEQGSVLYEGREVEGPSKRLIPGHDEIKLVKQDFELMPYLSVEDNILRQSLSLSEHARARLLGHLRSRLQLQNVRGRKAEQTSGGQKQRVALATALATQARVLLLDEPFSNLDFALKQDLIQMLRTEWKPEAMILVTHEPVDMLALADRVIAMKNGRIQQSGSTEEVYKHPKNEYVARLLGPVNVLSAENARKWGIDSSIPLLVRPAEIRVSRENGVEGKVSQCRFAGDGYLLQVSFDSFELEVWSREPFTEGTVVKLQIENKKAPSAGKRLL